MVLGPFVASGIFKAVVEVADNLFLVHLLTDEHDFLHSVPIFCIPVPHESRVALHQLYQIFFRSCGIPLSRLSELFLATCLFEQI